MEYWVYENWTHDYAMIHRAECGCCNYGKGKKKTFRNNGKWNGPYKTKEEAELKARQTKREKITQCTWCNKSTT